ncbi:MAG: phage portal protein [Mogibacterium sp.]|nr:phage portal protein [Mogibacterium sp.]
MAFWERLFGRQKQDYLTAEQVYKVFTSYNPTWHSWHGKIYESELVRAAVDAKARHISKLKVDFLGAARPQLQARMKYEPNAWQTWGQFLYRASTILDMQNTCFIAPIIGEFDEIAGYTTLLPSECELRNYEGTIWLLYRFRSGQVGAIEFDRVGILTKYQYKSEFFGESNGALTNTMRLLDIQSQGIEAAVKTAGNFSFIARLVNMRSPADLQKQQKDFNEKNLRADASGVLLFPNTVDNIQQVKSERFTISAEEQKLIQTNVQDYFGVNEKVIQNIASGDEMDSFFNGAIEPFAIMLSDIMTKMTYSHREQSHGAKVLCTANRLQYMAVDKKIKMAQQLGDRGMMTINEVRELFNYPPLPDGDRAIIRGEYYDSEDKLIQAEEE